MELGRQLLLPLGLHAYSFGGPGRLRLTSPGPHTRIWVMDTNNSPAASHMSDYTGTERNISEAKHTI